MTKPSEIRNDQALTITFPAHKGVPAPVVAEFYRDNGQLHLVIAPEGSAHPGIPAIVFADDPSFPNNEAAADAIFAHLIAEGTYETWAKSAPIVTIT